MEAISRKAGVLAIAIVFVVAIVVLQSAIDSERKELRLSLNGITSSASTLLQPLGGIKTAMAAYLWIRVDDIHDKYYHDLRKEEELVPLYRIVTWLDPRFEDAYYVGCYILILNKKPKEAWSFAQEGLQRNPESAFMEFNVGHLSLIYKKDYIGAIRHLERSYKLSSNDVRSRFMALSNLRTAYTKANMPEKAAVAATKLEMLPKTNLKLSTLRPELD